jgi:hypothetical protein
VTARILTAKEVRALLAEGREGAAEMERQRRKRVEAARDDVDALRAEVRRLRGLPLTPSCGACGWHESIWSGTTRGSTYCAHERAPKHTHVDHDSAPPSWCPLRGAR